MFKMRRIFRFFDRKQQQPLVMAPQSRHQRSLSGLVSSLLKRSGPTRVGQAVGDVNSNSVGSYPSPPVLARSISAQQPLVNYSFKEIKYVKIVT